MPSKLKNIAPTIPFSWGSLLAALVIGAALVGRCDRAQAQLVPHGAAQLQTNVDCGTLPVLLAKVQEKPVDKNTLYKILQIQQLEKEILS